MTPRLLARRLWEAILAISATSLAVSLVHAHRPEPLGGLPEGGTPIPCLIYDDGKVQWQIPDEVRDRILAARRARSTKGPTP